MFKKIILAGIFGLALTGCKSAEERAEAHYQNALTLLAEGDQPRAIIELRNVFDLDGRHKDARALYAKTVRDEGKIREAMSQYLLLVEQYPDDLEANRALAEMSLSNGDLPKAEGYLATALEIAPDDLELGGLDAFLSYIRARQDNDAEARARTIEKAHAILAQDDSQTYAQQVLIQDYIDSKDWQAALAALDRALVSQPDRLDLYRLKLGVLAAYDDQDAIDATLQDMAKRFPKDETVDKLLVSWYVQNNRLDGAEAWLRQQIDPQSDDATARLRLFQFLSQLRSPDIALDALSSALAEDPQPQDIAKNHMKFITMQAGLFYQTDRKPEAIALLQGALEGQPAGEDVDEARVSLARMYDENDQHEKAVEAIDAVLAHDAGQTEAIKVKAGWMIDADQTGDAIVMLRDALGDAPRDAGIMTLLARAHEREGSRSLMGEMLGLAVEASRKAPDESLRFARYLMSDGQYRSAENVLIDSLRLNSTDVQLLVELGKAHIALEDWPRAGQDVARLRELSKETNPRLAEEAVAAGRAADQMQATLLIRQKKTDALMQFLSERAQGDAQGQAAVIRANMLAGRMDEALRLAKIYAQDNPDLAQAQFIYGVVLDYSGQVAQAQTILHSVTSDHPEMLEPWLALYTSERRSATDEAGLRKASAVLAQALGHHPDEQRLQLLQAGDFERRGENAKALEIYKKIYAANSDNMVAANNYASMLMTLKSDDVSLQEAYIVARRLRGIDEPAFQDTFGWIAFRRGELDQAVKHLEAAAKGLSKDPTVQYHLGRTYAAMHQDAKAKAQYDRALLLLDQTGGPATALKTEIDKAVGELPVSN